MAMVQSDVQQSGPPYGLIVFAALTVILAAVSVWFYLKWDKAVEDRDQIQNQQDALLTAREAAGKDYKDVQTEAAKAPGQPSVVTYLIGQRAALRSDIAGDETLSNSDIEMSIDTSLAAAQAALGQENSASLAGLPLLGVLDTLTAACNTRTGEVNAAKAGRQAAESARDLAIDQKQQVQAKAEQANRKTLAEMEALQNKVAQALKDWDANLDKLRDQLDRLSQASRTEKQLAQNEIEETQKELDENKRRLQTLIDKVQQWRKEGGIDFAGMATRADGRIVKIVPGQNKVLVDIGEGEHLPLSLQFEVFSPAEPLTETTKSKATIQVVRVGPKLSECQVVSTAHNQTIMPGDLIVNTVYDRENKYVFHVIGEFDVYGSGRPDPAGAKTLEVLIERWGGKVVPDLDVQTDFLIVGTEPYVPSQPRDLDQAAVDLYEQKLRNYTEYTNTINRAIGLSIPMLNHKRFVYLLGLGDRSPLEPLYTE